MTSQLRRFGHIIERSPGNLASAVQSSGAQASAFLAGTPSQEAATGNHVAGAGYGWGGAGPAALVPAPDHVGTGDHVAGPTAKGPDSTVMRVDCVIQANRYHSPSVARDTGNT